MMPCFSQQKYVSIIFASISNRRYFQWEIEDEKELPSVDKVMWFTNRLHSDESGHLQRSIIC